MPEILAIWPIPAVIAMPKQPPIKTLTVGANIFEPDVRALMTPVRIRPPIVNPTMLIALAPKVGANAPAKGIKPPNVNEIAEATAASALI